MIYYNEAGQIVDKAGIDLEKGYLVDRTAVVHPAVTHRETRSYPGGSILYDVVDKVAWEEVTEQTYILYADHPTEADRLEAQVLYTAVMTDTLLEE